MAITRLNLADQLGKSIGYPGVLTTDNANEAYWLPAPTINGDYLLGHDPSKVLNWLGLGSGLAIVDGELITTGITTAYTTVLNEGASVNNSNTIIDIVGSGIYAADQGSDITEIGLDTTLNVFSQFNSNGFIVQTATDTFVSRELTGTSGRITITAGNGVSGNPVINVDPTFASEDLADSANIALLDADQTFTGNNIFSENVTMNDTPSSANHLVTKWYVDGLLIGQRRSSVELATDVDITLSGEQTIDGQLTASSRVLVRKQLVESENGIYISGSGAWTRASDMNTAAEVDGTMVIIEDGTQQGQLWYTVSDVVTLGTDPIVWTQLETGSLNGTGLTNHIAVWGSSTTLEYSTDFKFLNNQLSIGRNTYYTGAIISTKNLVSGGQHILRHENTGGTESFSIGDNGELIIGPSNKLTINNQGITAATSAADFVISAPSENIKITTGGNFPIITEGGAASSTGASVQMNATRTSATNNQSNVIVNGSFTPSGIGTNFYRDLVVQTTIDQSAGHTGVTAGIVVSPNLINAVDYRGVDITATGQTALRTNAGGVRFDLGGDQTGDMFHRAATTGFLTRIPVGTANQVLIGGTTPSFGAVPIPVNEIFVTNSDENFFDFTISGTGKDKDGNNITFSFPANQMLVDVYLNGQKLYITGTLTTLDYTIDSINSTLTLTEPLIETDILYIKKYA